MAGHRGQYVFGTAVGVVVAVFAYHWITDPAPRLERQQEESAVLAAREQLEAAAGSGLEFVDPLARNRAVGKGYVYRDGGGWQVSGFYRRDADDPWHPYLMAVTGDGDMLHLKVQDRALPAEAGHDPRIESVP